MHEVRLQQDAEGRIAVLGADPELWVSENLWRLFVKGETPPESLGGPVFAGEVLSFGLPERGLGRVRYRYLRYDRSVRTGDGIGVHVFERVDR